MFTLTRDDSDKAAERLAATGYWPARASALLAEGKYSRVVETCRRNLEDTPELVSGRLIYARALYHAGQAESAAEQLYHVLSLDPNNMTALIHLGHIEFTRGDEIAALSHYRRVQEIDPNCRGLKSQVRRPREDTTRTVTLSRAPEKGKGKKAPPLREIPFVTETIGDLYMSQSHPRLAAEVYRVLNKDNQNPRLAEKLARAEQLVKEKES